MLQASSVQHSKVGRSLAATELFGAQRMPDRHRDERGTGVCLPGG